MMKAQISILLIVILSQAHFSSAAPSQDVIDKFMKVVTNHKNNPDETFPALLKELSDTNGIVSSSQSITSTDAKTDYSDVVQNVDQVLAKYILSPVKKALDNILIAVKNLVDQPFNMIEKIIDQVQDMVNNYQAMVDKILSDVNDQIAEVMKGNVMPLLTTLSVSFVSTPTNANLLKLGYLSVDSNIIYLVINMAVKILGPGVFDGALGQLNGIVEGIEEQVLSMIPKTLE